MAHWKVLYFFLAGWGSEWGLLLNLPCYCSLRYIFSKNGISNILDGLVGSKYSETLHYYYVKRNFTLPEVVNIGLTLVINLDV